MELNPGGPRYSQLFADQKTRDIREKREKKHNVSLIYAWICGFGIRGFQISLERNPRE